MIKYNNSNINDWDYGTSNIIKVYRNNAVCYYKINVSSPSGQTPCFAVVADISQYSDTEFEDVFNQADEKWYKLNNLNQYEKYGIYGSGRTITTYEGKLTIDGGYEYQYSGGSWINLGEITGSTISLPDVPFVLNYNAKNYDSTTHSIPMTSGQLNDTDAVAYNNPDSIVDHHGDGYITISNSSMRIRKENQDISLFNRDSNSNNSDLTIITKALTTSDCNIITNRDSDYNWMYRQYSDNLTFHGNMQTGSISCSSSNPDILSVRTYYDNGTKVKYNNWTTSAETTPIDFTYGGTNSDSSSAGALFVGYAWNSSSEQWGGDFYWVYMAQANLTDAQIQQVIDYNEEGGEQSIYPLYYDEKADPPNNLSFSSMTEAEEYECPWVGMRVTINGSAYTFNDNYEWEEITSYWSVDTTQWQTSTAYGDLPSSGYSFYESFSNYHIDNATATTYITLYGFDTFDFKIRSYGESCCDYVIVYNLDSESSVKLEDNGNPQELQWRIVSFSGISTNVEHTIKVIYKKDGSVNGYDDRGYIAIPRQVVATSTTVVQGEYICYQGDKYQKLEVLEQYEGSSEWIHTGTYIRGNLIEASSTDCENRLPEGYTEVEYIESQYPNQAYMTTNYYPNNNTRVVCDFQYTYGETHRRLLGAGYWSGEVSYIVEAENAMSQQSPADLYLRFGYNGYSWIQTGAHIDMNRHTIDFNKNLFYMDNQLIYTCTDNTFTCSNPLNLFSDAETNYGMFGKIFSCQIYDNGTLVADFVPCINPSNVVGMYDIVGNTFYSSVNGNSFVAGPSV